jgi:PadR family transcriptional regulator PadR
MTAPRIRVTLVIMDVLDVVMSAPQDDPAWGLRICEATAHGPGTVYPALDRLMKAGWIEDRWEEPVPSDRPRRRLYTITSMGREAYTEAARARRERRDNWLRPAPQAGTVSWTS